MRHGLRAFSTVLIMAGVLLIADAAVTFVWQDPLSALYADQAQSSLDSQLGRLGRTQPTGLELRALRTLADESRRIAFLARLLRRTAKPGQAIGHIDIPKIRARFAVVEGTATADLTKGPGHYPDTSLPGLPGTVAIAGHRTTFLAPFRHIDRLRHGDRIVLDMPYGRFTYRVQRLRIVLPTATWITRAVGYDRLVLSACHPLYSASHRIVAFARLIDTQARGAARGPAGRVS